MKKEEKFLGFLVIFCLFSIVFTVMYSYAQEKITLTTYYPSPYGIYRELRVDGMAVGANYRYNPASPLPDGVLLVNGSIGIGTITPPAAGIQVSAGAIIPGVGNSNVAGIMFPSIGADNAYMRYYDEGAGNTKLRIGVGAGANDDISFFQNGADRLTVANNNVGIGTVNPAAILQVRSGAIMPEVGNSNAAGLYFPPNPGGGAGDEAFIRYFTEAGEDTKLRIGIANEANDDIAFWQQGADRMVVRSGRVGIGTVNPTQSLDVTGNMRVTGDIRADTSMTLGGETRTTWPTSSVGPEFNREIHNVKNGNSVVGMGAAANRACFLTRVRTEDLDSEGEWANCYVYINGGNWFLQASTGPDCDDCDVICRARCVLW